MFKVVIIKSYLDQRDLENALKDGYEIYHTTSCHSEHGFIVYTLKKEKTK
jgi:hypothetical protein